MVLVPYGIHTEFSNGHRKSLIFVTLKIRRWKLFIIAFPVSERWEHAAHIWVCLSEEFLSFVSEMELIMLSLETHQ